MPQNKDITTAEAYAAEVIRDEVPKAAEELDITAFLPENVAKVAEEIITIDAPPGYNNPDGTRAKMQLRKPSFAEIADITNRYRNRRILKNNKGHCLTTDRGRVAFDENTDSMAVNNALIAACLVFPNPGDMKLMAKHVAGSKEDMIPKLFPSQEAYLYILERVTELISGTQLEEDELVEQAKN